MKKAQYYRSCKGRKTTAKAVKDTATTVTKNETTGQSSRSTTAQTDSPFAELFPERFYNLTLPTMEEVLSSIPDYEREGLKSVYGDEDELSWVFDKTMRKCPLEEAILSSYGLLGPIEAINQIAAEGFRLSVAALEIVAFSDTTALLESYNQPKPSEDFVKRVPDWIMKELSSASIPNDVKKIVTNRILHYCEQQLKKQWSKIMIPLPELAIASSILMILKAEDLRTWNGIFRLGAIDGAGQFYSSLGGDEKEPDGTRPPENCAD